MCIRDRSIPALNDKKKEAQISITNNSVEPTDRYLLITNPDNGTSYFRLSNSQLKVDPYTRLLEVQFTTSLMNELKISLSAPLASKKDTLIVLYISSDLDVIRSIAQCGDITDRPLGIMSTDLRPEYKIVLNCFDRESLCLTKISLSAPLKTPLTYGILQVIDSNTGIAIGTSAIHPVRDGREFYSKYWIWIIISIVGVIGLAGFGLLVMRAIKQNKYRRSAEL
eukprot:TRINITY_DN3678_c0_g1_i24.p1 TRINITY_DN3678_c0_g1~~TRINITY_DN3678_c0_g1_i24.p1  ORF type:complete len:244 (+),score=37.60 TRINITY_DN3678_c0_g1_i24:62-733(+)